MMEYKFWKREFIDTLEHVTQTDEAIRNWISGRTEHMDIFPDPNESLNWFDDLAIFDSPNQGTPSPDIEKTETQTTFIAAMAENDSDLNLRTKLNTLGALYDKVCRYEPESQDKTGWISFAASTTWNEFIVLSREILSTLKDSKSS